MKSVIICGGGSRESAMAARIVMAQISGKDTLCLQHEGASIVRNEPIIFKNYHIGEIQDLPIDKKYFNFQKHNQSCAKNRKKRKSKKRH